MQYRNLILNSVASLERGVNPVLPAEVWSPFVARWRPLAEDQNDTDPR
jgi:hypothetical protein